MVLTKKKKKKTFQMEEMKKITNKENHISLKKEHGYVPVSNPFIVVLEFLVLQMFSIIVGFK